MRWIYDKLDASVNNHVLFMARQRADSHISGILGDGDESLLLDRTQAVRGKIREYLGMNTGAPALTATDTAG